MNLTTLLQEISPIRILGNTNIKIRKIVCDSREASKGDLFVAVKGVNSDGHKYIKEALGAGAVAVIVNEDFLNSDIGRRVIAENTAVVFISVVDTSQIFAVLADIFFDAPSSKMPVIGVTGTNGKTTVTYIIEHICCRCGLDPAVIGTVSNRVKGNVRPSDNTTPNILKINEVLSFAADCDAPVGILEVSSHAIKQKRVDGVQFDVKVLTNITSDHLDYHATLEEYQNAKLSFFQNRQNDFICVLNKDDFLFNKLNGNSNDCIVTYAIENDADFRAVNEVSSIDGVEFDIAFQDKLYHVDTVLIGRHNVYNILAAVSAVSMIGIDPEDAVSCLNDFSGAPGRLECVYGSQDNKVFIDYAHTTDGLDKVLSVLKSLVSGKLIVVFGCGGDRDKSKRPLMGEIAEKYADRIYITNDNPRSEIPGEIADDILSGIKDRSSVVVELDRHYAIKEALDYMSFKDCVLIAGKGHETYQIIGEECFEFNDADIVRKILGSSKKKGVTKQ